jgi:predicted ribosome quality control (RQC) complex YloA/Tae2 family protein
VIVLYFACESRVGWCLWLDALLLHALAGEINGQTAGARLVRVDQPAHHDVLLTVRKPGGACKVLLSADPRFPRMHITSSAPEMPKQAPAFCMLLRKRLEGGRIQSVEPVGMDRICMVRILSRDDLGNAARWTLVLEATGRNANLMLLDPESRVVAAARQTPRSGAAGDASPGTVYLPPAIPSKTHPRDVTGETFSGLADVMCEEAVLRRVAGFGRTLAREACRRAGVSGELAGAVLEIWQESQSASWAHVFLDAEGNPVDAHVVLIASHGVESFESPSAALDHYYERVAEQATVRATRQSLGQKIRALAARTTRRLESRLEELDEAQTKDVHRRAGDLILTYLPQVAKALTAHYTSVSLVDPGTGDNIEVDLNLSLDAPANAQLQYRRYAKLKARSRLLAPLVEKDRDDLSYFESVTDSVERAEDLDDLNDIARELRDQGFLERDTPRGHSAQEPAPRCMRLLTSDGREMLAGRNNRQNEYVTFRAASRQDLWFHAKPAPGAHVVLRMKGNAPASEMALLEAATVAATLSRARAATKVEVDFTEAQNVRKRPGSRPGMVFYDKHQTIVVRPDPGLVARLQLG